MQNTDQGRAEYFGRWISARLKARGWTQKEFADRMHKDKGVVGNWVRGERVPNSESCIQIADALDYEPDVVLTEAGHRPPIFKVDPNSAEGQLVPIIRKIAWQERDIKLIKLQLLALAEEYPREDGDE